MYAAFLRDPAFLVRYHIVRLFGLCGLVAGMFFLRGEPTDSILWLIPSVLLLSSVSFGHVVVGCGLALGVGLWRGHLELSHLALAPIAVLCTLFATMLLHNAAHGNFRSKYVERVVGETMGLFQLVGFADWVIVHVLHHAHADDAEKDPHPPLGLKFGEFLFGMRNQIGRSLAQAFVQRFGDTPASAASLARIAAVSRVEQFFKVLFWLFALGPSGFAAFFAVSVVMKMVHYAWFNYVTHRPSIAGVEIRNLDSGVYRLVNVLAAGLYYHQNHHLNPKLFDPRKYVPREERTSDLAA